jgi:deoxyribodipyrimidine photo-lyase
MTLKKVVFIFRRDFRIEDNTTLYNISKLYDVIIPVFFLTKEQVGSTNKYRSTRSVNFMLNSIKEMNIPVIEVADYKEIPNIIIKNYGAVDGIAFNKDYTPYACKRDSFIESFCTKHNIAFHSYHDQLLLRGLYTNNKGVAYSIFTPFYTRAKKLIKKYVRDEDIIKSIMIKLSHPIIENHVVKKEAYKILRKDIKEDDNTKLSVYLKFGIVSPREVSRHKTLWRKLLWRDFYYNHYVSFPYTPTFDIKWSKNKELFQKWVDGKTGFPIVDAIMRQLKEEGYIINRHRMIVASFLSKNLHIDWREGEKYFSNQLIDIDRIQNMAGWMSVVGVAKHSLPYFRVLNPWIQSKEYDVKCKFIKKWVPELKSVSPVHIHNWYVYNSHYSLNYPDPIVNYEETKEYFLDSVKNTIRDKVETNYTSNISIRLID